MLEPMLAKIAVIVVPILAPKNIGIAASMPIRPCWPSNTKIPVVAALD